MAEMDRYKPLAINCLQRIYVQPIENKRSVKSFVDKICRFATLECRTASAAKIGTCSFKTSLIPIRAIGVNPWLLFALRSRELECLRTERNHGNCSDLN